MSSRLVNAQRFIHKISEAEIQDLITNKDFDLFKDLGLKLFSREYLESINVLPPLCWGQVTQIFERFVGLSSDELDSWLTDKEIYQNYDDYDCYELTDLDCFLSLSAGSSSLFPFNSLRYLRMHFSHLELPDNLLPEFSLALTLSENSLKLEFKPSPDVVFDEDFPSLFSAVMKHFSTSKLKVFSIRNLNCDSLEYSDIAQLILSNRLSLKELEIRKVELKEPTREVEIHLPNIEKIGSYEVDLQMCGFRLIIGEKLLWIRDYHDDLTFEFESKLSAQFNQRSNQKLLAFLKNYPNLEGFDQGSQYSTEQDELAEAFKSLKHLKCLHLMPTGPIQNYIGSEKIEELALDLPEFDKVDWSCLVGLKNLVNLRLWGEFNPSVEFFDYLKLDRLELLSFIPQYSEEKEVLLFFEAISQLKRLKTLRLCIDRVVKNPVLSESVEYLTVKISEPFLGDYHELSILDYLPIGKGVRHLELSNDSGFEKIFKYLKRYYPNVETAEFKEFFF